MEKYKVKSKRELKEIILNSSPDADLNYLDVSEITDMSWLFWDSDFNGRIDQWDVSNVKNMSFMFAHSSFNGDISSWDVSKVEDMSWMFWDSYFTGDMSKWEKKSNFILTFFASLFGIKIKHNWRECWEGY